MHGSKKVIQFSAGCSIISGIVTYLVSVNMETGWLTVNSVWISNTFVLTLSGGVLASFLVILLSEWKKYMDLKLEAETAIFFQTFYLYQQLFTLWKTISEYLENSHKEVPKGLLYTNANMAECQRNAIRSISYDAFSAKNPLMLAHDLFCKDVLVEVDHTLAHRFYLDIAINSVQIQSIERIGTTVVVTSEMEPVHKTLCTLYDEYAALMSDVDEYLCVVDQCCDYRYKWSFLKSSLEVSYVSLSETETFEDYIQCNDDKR